METKVSCCLHQEGFHVDIREYTEDLLRIWSGKKLFCPICGSKMIYRRGTKRVAHFAHLSACTYKYYEPETEEHIHGKQAIKKWLEALYPNNQTYIEYYVKQARQIADVMTIFPDGHRLCVEIQCSPLSEEMWKQRFEGYSQEKISQLWIIGKSLINADLSKLSIFRMNHFLPALYQKLNGRLFLFSHEKEQMIFLLNIAPIKGYKTLFSCSEVWKESIYRTKISKWGTIESDKVEKYFAKKRVHLIERKQMEEQRNLQLVNIMKPWTDPEIHSNHKLQYKKTMKEQPIYTMIKSFYDLDQQVVSVLFDQTIEGDQVMKVDHRLWQAYLFFTEIYNVYRRSSRYDSGMRIPKLFVKNIDCGGGRTPYRPFKEVLKPYINQALLRAKRIDPITFAPVLTVHEIIFEYLKRLAHLGFLNILFPQNLEKSGARLFGRFEILFDRFYPDLFHTEEGVRKFFQSHKLRYRRRVWIDENSGKVLD